MPKACDIETVPPPDLTAQDIAQFVERLPEPDRALCAAVLLLGEVPYLVGRRYRLTAAAVRQRIRAAMRPLWEELQSDGGGGGQRPGQTGGGACGSSGSSRTPPPE